MDKSIMGFGIAGNFANHLEQAGEEADFVDVVVDEDDAPKGIFPTYMPKNKTFLSVYPFSADTITAPEGKEIQMEPEIALLCNLTYEGSDITSITPAGFMAYNDCSIRIEGAEKISHKKNWGENSKGVSDQMIDIVTFDLGCVMDDYSLTSFIKRGGEVIQYGENSELLGYSYFYGKLKGWMIDKLNTQEDTGPLENLKSLILESGQPEKMLISIGATRYTKFGESHYLQKGDILYVIVYNHVRYDHERIIQMIEEDEFSKMQISVLRQEVV